MANKNRWKEKITKREENQGIFLPQPSLSPRWLHNISFDRVVTSQCFWYQWFFFVPCCVPCSLPYFSSECMNVTNLTSVSVPPLLFITAGRFLGIKHKTLVSGVSKTTLLLSEITLKLTTPRKNNILLLVRSRGRGERIRTWHGDVGLWKYLQLNQTNEDVKYFTVETDARIMVFCFIVCNTHVCQNGSRRIGRG